MPSEPHQLDRADADRLREFLSGRDVECPLCGYNLRDLATDRCPECGDELLLRVNVAEQRVAAPTVGLIGLTGSTGFGVLIMLFAVAIRVIHPDASMDHGPFYCSAISGITGIGLMILWLRNWRKIRKQPTRTRWLLALLCWLHPALTLGGMLWTMR